ncbi:MAG TPA: primosomal protein N' [Phnomibacter sp.]|nr:primosomal protein N' [Phnomibacter sp.]
MSQSANHNSLLFQQERPTVFADIIVPVYLPKTLTWGIPKEWQATLQPGCRVEVQVGKSKRYAGIIKRIHHELPGVFDVKSIISVLDETPVVQREQLELWNWIARYYCCSEGEVMAAALPAHLKLSSESILQYNDLHDVPIGDLSDREYVVTEALEIKQRLTLSEIQSLLDSLHVYPVVKKLVDKGIATVWESLQDKYKEKTETYITLAQEYRDEKALEHLINSWKKAPKQLDLLLAFLHFERSEGQVIKNNLLKKSGATSAILDGLVSKEILLVEKRSVDRLPQIARHIDMQIEFSAAQQLALQQLQVSLQANMVTLLHGVTGSGKTQLYIQLIAEEIKKGNQCLYLLPEIALTSQIIRKLRQHLGGYVGIYHSKFNPNERLELWNKVLSGEIQVVLGARSALFLPFSKLSLVVVDEEHDSSFKQYDPPPRYHARDAAIYYASLFKAKVLLGSATPSLETYYNCESNKYGLVTLLERYGDLQLPDLNIVDLKLIPEAKKSKVILSQPMKDAIEQTLQAGKQVIVFQNRRGYSPYQLCNVCGWIPKCDHCDVSLTYHKSTQKLHCHYCGTTYPLAKTCANCGSHDFKQKNFGTEQLEEYLDTEFSNAVVARMDTDSVRGKHSHENLIKQFEEQRVNILAGTQMVVKGLDFDHVGLVCIPDADGIMRFADFRASERAFQLIEQVSGRAGRKGEKGKVLVQMFDTNHPVLPFLQQHDYKGFYQYESDQRKLFAYPPFTRLILLQCKHKNQITAWQAGEALAKWLSVRYSGYINGPAEPLINRVRNEFITEILLKLPRNAATLETAKQTIQTGIIELHLQASFKSVRVSIDVDPQ